MASSIYESSRGCIWRRVERGADFASALPFVGLALPMLPPIAPPPGTTAESRTPFREPLQFIVMSVTVLTCIGISDLSVPGGGHRCHRCHHFMEGGSGSVV